MGTDKNTDDSEDILDELHRTGFRKYRVSNLSLFLSALTAGLEIGFSALLIGVILTSFQEDVPANWMRIMVGVSYPVGFILVIVGKSELFTEHTSLAMIPVLSGKATVKELLGLWGFVLLGNLIGGFVFALFISWFGPARGIISIAAFEEIGKLIVEPRWHVLFASAVLAGWLMGLLGWLVSSVSNSISQILIIGLITFVIGVGHLHHSVVGSVEMLSVMLVSETVSLMDYLYFLLFAVLGNTVGGAIFVSLLKYEQVEAE